MFGKATYHCVSIINGEKHSEELSNYFIKDTEMFFSECKSKGLKEVVLLQKCNAIEIYLYGEFENLNIIYDIWQTYSFDYSKFKKDKITYYGGESCIKHLFMTISGLKSVVLGDNQVLGQVKKSIYNSKNSKIETNHLDILFEYAKKVGSDIKNKTLIGNGSASVPSATLEIIESLNLRKDLEVLVIGAGSMGMLMCKLLKEKLYKNITISNRTLSKSLDLFNRNIVTSYSKYENLKNDILKYDIIIFAVDHVFKESDFDFMDIKKHRYVFDLGNPESTFLIKNKFNNISFFNIESIKNYINKILCTREKEYSNAIKIINKHLGKFKKFFIAKDREVKISNNYKTISETFSDKNKLENKKKYVFIKNILLHEVRKFYFEKSFLEVTTPTILPIASDPVRDKNNDELFPVDWYGKKMFLRQSNQLHKQYLVLSGFEKIYEIGPFWRKEKIETQRHSAEAWGLDVESQGVNDANSILKHISELFNKSTQELFNKGLIKKNDIIKNIPIFSYNKIYEILKSKNIQYNYGVDLGYNLELILSKIIREDYGYDIFGIVHYPDTIKKFYTKKIPGGLTETFDIIYKGREICSGACRQTDVNELKHEISGFVTKIEKYNFYFDKLEENPIDHWGFCIGIDRFLARLLGVDSIKDVTLFPRGKTHILP